MFQITFSKQSLRELQKLLKPVQMELLDAVSTITKEVLEKPDKRIGVLQREGKTLYRLRAGDFRLYFELIENNLNVNCILHKDTWADFAFRCKLPITEDQLIEKDPSFWTYLDNLSQK